MPDNLLGDTIYPSHSAGHTDAYISQADFWYLTHAGNVGQLVGLHHLDPLGVVEAELFPHQSLTPLGTYFAWKNLAEGQFQALKNLLQQKR